MTVRQHEGPPNAVVLAAAASNEISASDPQNQHGLLTYYLLSGLHGAADANGDGKITTRELYAYLRPAVERAARLQNIEQIPVLSVPKDGPTAERPWLSLAK